MIKVSCTTLKKLRFWKVSKIYEAIFLIYCKLDCNNAFNKMWENFKYNSITLI